VMWKAVQKGWKPPKKVTKNEYIKMEKSPKKSPKRSFIGHAASFAGQFFTSYASTNNIEHQQKTVVKIAPISKLIKFSAGNYTQYSKLTRHILYCDPPYENTQQHYRRGDFSPSKFDSKKFYEWCFMMAKNNLVFVSSYKLPKQFKQIWNSGKECLFMLG
jgi:site-specific DNA-adenine methylase